MVWFVFSMVNMERTILLDTLITMEVDHMVMDQVQEDIPHGYPPDFYSRYVYGVKNTFQQYLVGLHKEKTWGFLLLRN